MTILVLGGIFLLLPQVVQAFDITSNGVANLDIVTGNNPTPAEKTAAAELATYLEKATDTKFTICEEKTRNCEKPAIYLGNTEFAKKQGLNLKEFGPEEWTIKTIGDNLVLAGGRPRGTIYAVYHFLEDIVGIHWWNPFEETVPEKTSLAIPAINRREKPTFRYRDIYQFYCKDDGKYAARSRLNHQGDEKMSVKYGGSLTYGLPYHCHTMELYFKSKRKEYFKNHPDWFPLIDGKRQCIENSQGYPQVQLCLTNKELQDFFVEKLKGFIKESRKRAILTGLSIPIFYSIDMNDISGGWCQCENCEKIFNRENSQAGGMLYFANSIADQIKTDYPDIYIATIAYYATEKPPKTIKPRDNVFIRLCNTGNSLVVPFASDKKSMFYKNVCDWSKITKNLAVWDYGITYRKPATGLPTPSLRIYEKNYRFLANQGIMGIFTEFEHPITSDLRDMKLWVVSKLKENPYQNTQDLIKAFTDGFYGPAGENIRQYLKLLEKGFDAKPSYIGTHSEAVNYRYLDLNLIRKAQLLFDEANKKVANNPVFLRRLRHARLSLDRASLLLYPKLAQEWSQAGGTCKNFPLDRKQIAARIDKTFKEQWAFRQLDQFNNPDIDDNISEFIENALALRYTEYPIPKKFRKLPTNRVFDFPVDKMRLHRLTPSDAPDTFSGQAVKIEVGENKNRWYSLPLTAGLYDQVSKQSNTLGRGGLTAKEIPGPGFHWYKIGRNCKLTPSTYLYLFGSWFVQIDLGAILNPKKPDERFDIWVSLKFEGSQYPYSKSGDKNAVYVERVILVSK